MKNKTNKMTSIFVIGIVSLMLLTVIKQNSQNKQVNTSSSVDVNTPYFSHSSGFYDGEFELEIFSEEGSNIYYTLDGSDPDENANRYCEPIHIYDRSSESNVYNLIQNTVYDWNNNHKIIQEPVAKASVVKAIAMSDDGQKSDVVSATYFVNKTDLQDGLVISLTAEYDDLFGSKEGILVTGAAYDKWYLNGQIGKQPTTNYMQSGEDWERPAGIEVFKDGQCILTQNAGVRVQGASTRNEHKKRMRLISRKKYSGSNQFLAQPFGENKSGTWLLRGANEDVILQDMMDNTELARQRGIRCRTFINGEYWYDFLLREYYDPIYFESYYGIPKDNLIVYKNGEIEEGTDNDKVYYDQLYNYVQCNDLADESNYKYVQEMMDIQSYIEYLCGNIYCANMDSSEVKNVLMWRSRVDNEGMFQDGKWRWALFDMDSLGWVSLEYYGVSEPAQIDSFSVKGEHVKNAWNEGILYSALKENEEFRKQFVLTFMDMMNTSFSISNVSEKLSKFELDTSWKQSFFVNRPQYMKEYLKKEFHLKGSVEKIQINMPDSEQGTIVVNSKIICPEEGTWTGEYFTDYPITVKVTPAEGYEFIGWNGDIESEEDVLEIELSEGGVYLEPKFKFANEKN